MKLKAFEKYIREYEIENFLDEAEALELDFSQSYFHSYDSFVKFFREKRTLEWEDIVVGAHMVYGWMPTIILMKYNNVSEVTRILNKAKTSLISVQEIQVLIECVNNSMVGVSKLLHFINQKEYAIWDSRIYRYLTKQPSYSRLKDPDAYSLYLQFLSRIEQNTRFKSIKDRLNVRFKDNNLKEVSSKRCIELLMFELDKQEQETEKRKVK